VNKPSPRPNSPRPLSLVACPYKVVMVGHDNRPQVISHSPTLAGAITTGRILKEGNELKGEKYVANKRRPENCSWMSRHDSIEIIFDDRPSELQLKRIRADHFQRMISRVHPTMALAVSALPQVETQEAVAA
jgi:hypothetical protein